MKDGSGNLLCSATDKDCNVQPDAATEWKLGHAKKIPNDDSKGISIFML
jgi:hypothetical protein